MTVLEKSLFCFWAFGDAFDPDAFLQDSSWESDEVWRVGEPMRERLDGQLEPHSGFKIDIGDGRSMTPAEQHAAAISFLRAHESELERLRIDGATTRMLGIDVRLQPMRNAVVFSITPPRPLLRELVRQKVELEYFVVRDA